VFIKLNIVLSGINFGFFPGIPKFCFCLSAEKPGASVIEAVEFYIFFKIPIFVKTSIHAEKAD